MTKTGKQSTRHHEMHTEEHALKKRLPFTTFFRLARAAFIGTPTLPLLMEPFINWAKLSQDDLDIFEQKLTEGLNSINIPSAVFHGSHICLDDCHKVCIENYYGDSVTAIKNAKSFLPKTNPCIHRSFWTDELTDLKHASLECTNFWKQCGRPNTGPVFQCKKNCHYRYKIALRKEKLAAKKKISDDMYNDLLNRDNTSFWKAWNSLNRVGHSLVSRVEGETDEKNIANVFAKYFESVYGGSDTDEHEFLKDEFTNSFSTYFSNHINDDIMSSYLTWSDMVELATKIKIGKATVGFVKPQHFIHGGPRLLQHFQILFNGMDRSRRISSKEQFPQL